MKRDILDVSELRPQAILSGVEFCDNKVTVGSAAGAKGSGLFVSEKVDGENAVLVGVPSDLVLSLENVWVYAKSDRHLRDILDATGDFSRVTHGATDGVIGASNFFSIYVNYLPREFGLPTLWEEDELRLLQGTSLEPATATKLKSLDREFTLLREKTAHIDWCQKYWWNADSGTLSFNDWKVVDAMYRSRAMDLPGTGFATVPIMDMANHAVGTLACARYETDSEGNAVLTLKESHNLTANDEITISYGDDNGASEMLHSYGFIDPTMCSAKQLWLDIDVPDDDPLRLAKKHAADSAPGFRLFEKSNENTSNPQATESSQSPIQWEGPYVWLININEEDGLEFKLLRTNDGETEIQMSWKGTVLSDLLGLEALLSKEPQYVVFRLRVITMLRERMFDQLSRLEQSKDDLDDILQNSDGKSINYDNAMRLRALEERMMTEAYDAFGIEQATLIQSKVVQEYLGNLQKGAPDEGVPEVDDFS